ncbi:MAG TPA: hypothetical protein VGZ73_14315 [Bryobacteraceae bacterium]|nr:hypothetical protein [Bryobacteraceae bacterium]
MPWKSVRRPLSPMQGLVLRFRGFPMAHDMGYSLWPFGRAL